MQPYRMQSSYKLVIFILTCFGCFLGGSVDGKNQGGRENQVRSAGNFSSRSAAHSELPGGKYSSPANAIAYELRLDGGNSTSGFKLPSWFNYDQFKSFFGKRYSAPEVDEIHRRIFLRTALKVFQQRALYRINRADVLPSINELSDMTTSELFQLTRRVDQTEQTFSDDLTCCTYEQVHEKIIELLDRTSGEKETDLALSGAYVDELQQKPLPGAESKRKTSNSLNYEHDLSKSTVDRALSIEIGSDNYPSPAGSSEGAPLRVQEPSVEFSRSNPFGRKSPTNEAKSALAKDRPLKDSRTGSEAPGGQARDLRWLQESVRQQIANQLSSNSSLGKRLSERLSSYFGEPVELTVDKPSASSTGESIAI